MVSNARRQPLGAVAVVLTAVAVAVGCSSGPAPADARSYDVRIAAWRTQKDTAFRTGSDSPLPAAARGSFAGLAYFPIDPAYHVPALLKEDRSGPPVIIEMETSQAERDKMRRVGTLGFSLAGVEYHLTAFAGLDDPAMARLFVPFGDLTNGADTYKGGRFLDLDRTATDLYDLDFNRAYQPFCVYNPEYICPVPPRENRLAVAIRAGEKLRDVDRH